MKLLFACVLILVFVGTGAVGQQPQSPFTPAAAAPPVTAPINQPTAGQNTTPADHGAATNPTDDGTIPGQVGIIPPDPNAGVTGTLTNPSARPALGLTNTNQVITTNAPLFLNVMPLTVTDSNGAPIGALQQLALSPSGQVNFGIINSSGRLVPVPWQLIVSGTTGARGTLALNAEPGILQRAPPVAMGQLPMLTEEDVQANILGHFGLQPRTQPSVVTTGSGGTGRSGGLGVTITGGANSTAFGAPVATNTLGSVTNLNTNALPNNMRTNQAVNTTGGLLSPTGRTNGIDPYNSGPGSTDRFGPRQNANPVQPVPAVPPVPPAGPQR